jgi:acyl carrier protein
MEQNKLIGELKEIGSAVFKNNTLDIDETSVLEDISGWNSLRHIMFIDTIEKKYQIQFTFEEMLELSSIKAICEKIVQKLG